MLRLSIDLDGTICTNKLENQTYSDVVPIFDAVETLKFFKKQGYYIIIHTARNMRTCSNNLGAVIKNQAKLVSDWLEKYEIPYDELLFGKPHVDLVVDDKSLEFKNNWKEIKEKILQFEYKKRTENSKIERVISSSPWSEEELKFLQEIYPVLFTEEIYKFFPNRTTKAVKEKAKFLKIGKKERKIFFPKEYCNSYEGGYISGLIDGEGSFVVSLNSSTSRKRVNYNPKFTIALRLDDLNILNYIRNYFDCGSLYIARTQNQINSNWKPQASYSIAGLYDIMNSLIPHLEKYPLMAKKKNDYQIWKKMVELQAKHFRGDWADEVENQMKDYYEQLKAARNYIEPDLLLANNFKKAEIL